MTSLRSRSTFHAGLLSSQLIDPHKYVSSFATVSFTSCIDGLASFTTHFFQDGRVFHIYGIASILLGKHLDPVIYACIHIGRRYFQLAVFCLVPADVCHTAAAVAFSDCTILLQSSLVIHSGSLLVHNAEHYPPPFLR